MAAVVEVGIFAHNNKALSFGMEPNLRITGIAHREVAYVRGVWVEVVQSFGRLRR